MMRSARSLIAVLASLLALGLLAVAPLGAQEGDTLEVDLTEIDGSGINGTAILTDEGDAVTVEIEVSGEAVVGDHPVHIHEGTCDNLDPAPLYPLADVDEDGLSETTIEGTSLEELTSAPHAINAHLSAEEIGVYVTCGNLTTAGPDAGAGAEDDGDEDASAAGGETEDDDDAAGTGGTTTTIPASGVGTTFGSSDGGLLLALIALAAVLAVGGVALRIRESRA
jgi:hypothetical protein